MDDLVELHKFIDSMSDDDVRRFLAVYTYSHTCQGARMRCCGELRCESCHVAHLRSAHGPHAASFWAKLVQSERITWTNRRPHLPVNGHKPKSRPTRRKEVNDPVRYQEVPELDALDKAIELMTKELRAKGVNI